MGEVAAWRDLKVGLQSLRWGCRTCVSGIIGKHGHHVESALGGGGTFWGTSQAGLTYPSWPGKIVCWGDNVCTP